MTQRLNFMAIMLILFSAYVLPAVEIVVFY
jgi:hypothetical protein